MEPSVLTGLTASMRRATAAVLRSRVEANSRNRKKAMLRNTRSRSRSVLRRADELQVALLRRGLVGEEPVRRPCAAAAGSTRQRGELGLDLPFRHAAQALHLRVGGEGRFLPDHRHDAADVAAGVVRMPFCLERRVNSPRPSPRASFPAGTTCRRELRTASGPESMSGGPCGERAGGWRAGASAHRIDWPQAAVSSHCGQRLSRAVLFRLCRLCGNCGAVPFLDKPPPPCALAPEIPFFS